MILLRALILVLALATFAGTALAQETTANALIELGTAQRRDGRVQEALASFERASAMERSPRVVAQLGLTHAMLEHWLVAYSSLTEALGATHDDWISSRREALERALAEIRTHLSLLRLGDCDGDAQVSIDGQAVFMSGDSVLPLLPGAHDVAVRGRASAFEQSVTASAGESVLIQCRAMNAPEITRTGSSGSAPVEPQPAPSRVSVARVLGFVGLGLGAVGVGVGVTFNVMRESDVRDAAACGSRYTCYDDAALRASSRNTPMLIGYVAGGALIAASVLTLVLSAGSSPSDDSRAFVCAPNLDRVGATCSGSF